VKKLQLHVDRIACDGAGYCAEIAPEIIELDDWGFPIIKDTEIHEDGPDIELARKALRICPRQALALRLREQSRSAVSGG
jgi:ferredoxin